MIGIDDWQAICRDNKIKWTLHALKRIRKRKISSNAVINAIMYGEVITYYHDDKPFPSYLIFNGIEDSPIHVVASTDNSTIYIITAYIPTLDEWEDDFKTRRKD